jgi:type 1 glutamine amidotransferase
MKMNGSTTAIMAGISAAVLVAGLYPAVITAQAPAPAAQTAPGGRGGRGFGRGGPQNEVANVVDLQQMMAALPDAAPAAPKSPRRVLVLAKAQGFVHSSIPLAARTVEALGQKTGAWSTVISYDPADITAENLANYDAIFLDSTTGTFLDDPAHPDVTTARKKAFMDFVRGGKGLAVIHAGTDSYHSQGNGGDPLWPEFNQMIGGYFKWHWLYPTQITMKVEDVSNPINAPFTTMRGGQRVAQGAGNLAIVDEVYTFAMNSWDRSKVHVLTSIDYDKMLPEVKAQEAAEGKRTDGDYVLSYIHKEGQGRVFVEVLGHHESIYKLRPMLEHILAGVQYALGDLEANDAPVSK